MQFKFAQTVRGVAVAGFAALTLGVHAQTTMSCANTAQTTVPSSVEFVAVYSSVHSKYRMWKFINGSSTNDFTARMGIMHVIPCLGGGTGPSDSRTQWVSFDLKTQSFFDVPGGWGDHIILLNRAAHLEGFADPNLPGSSIYNNFIGQQFRGPIFTSWTGIQMEYKYYQSFPTPVLIQGGCQAGPAANAQGPCGPTTNWHIPGTPAQLHDNVVYRVLIHASERGTGVDIRDANNNLLGSTYWEGSDQAMISGGFGLGFAAICKAPLGFCDGNYPSRVSFTNISAGWF